PPPATALSTPSLHDALPICSRPRTRVVERGEAFSAARLRRRIGALVVVMALAFSAVVVRLVFVQGLSSTRYATFGQSQRLSTVRSEEHTSELQSPYDLVCRL